MLSNLNLAPDPPRNDAAFPTARSGPEPEFCHFKSLHYWARPALGRPTAALRKLETKFADFCPIDGFFKFHLTGGLFIFQAGLVPRLGTHWLGRGLRGQPASSFEPPAGCQVVSRSTGMAIFQKTILFPYLVDWDRHH